MGSPMKPLPFKCHGLQEASQAHVEVAKKASADKCEVLFPIGLPDEGTFDWLDQFLEKNPQYTELSDRKIIEWANKSGLWGDRYKGRGKGGNWDACNDKPDFNFGVYGMDNRECSKIINSIAGLQPRNYVVMEVRQNLIPEERAALLKRFPKAHYKRTAKVVMGEPKADFKKVVKDRILKQKQAKEDVIYQKQKYQREQKKLADQKRKEQEEKKKAVLEARAKAAEEVK